MDWTMLGWRDGVLVLVALAAVYLVHMLIKLTQLGRHHVGGDALQEPAVQQMADELLADIVSPPQWPSEPEPQSVMVAAAYAEEREEIPPAGSFAVPPAQAYEWDEVKSLFGDPAESVSPSTDNPVARRTGGFGEHLAEHLARSDVEMEVQRMRSEMERMRGEMEALRAASRVSPQYAEAMELAQRGLTAQDLADRLGISLGEAELVHALSCSDRNFDEGEEHGAEQYATEFNEFERRNRHPGG